MNPVRNSWRASNPAGIILGPNPTAEQRGIISNGVKVLLLFGVALVISGGGGAPLTSLKGRGGYFHYVWISVQREKIEGEVVDWGGQIQDRFVIE
jgi:hypothetical protein